MRAGVFALGVAAAILAGVLYSIGVALQALDARAAPPEQAMRLTLLGRLLRRPRWLLGGVIGALGLPLQILAVAEAPFVVVQPLLAVGLLALLALGARMLSERVGRVELGAVLGMAGGAALLAWGAPDHVETHRAPGVLLAVVGGLVLLSLAPFALRCTSVAAPVAITVGSGLGYGASNVATKLLGDDLGSRHWEAAALWGAATVLAGVGALIAEMTAFQRLAATTVVPIAFAVQTFVPIALEPLFLRERWSSAALGGGPLLAGLALTLGATVALARNRGVSALAAGGDRPPPRAR